MLGVGLVMAGRSLLPGPLRRAMSECLRPKDGTDDRISRAELPARAREGSLLSHRTGTPPEALEKVAYRLDRVGRRSRRPSAFS